VSEYLSTARQSGPRRCPPLSLAVSPATVRAVMGELGRPGMLRHPAHLGGAHPTDRRPALLRGHASARAQPVCAEQEEIRERLGKPATRRDHAKGVARAARSAHSGRGGAGAAARSDACRTSSSCACADDQLLAVIRFAQRSDPEQLIPRWSLSPAISTAATTISTAWCQALTVDQIARAVCVRSRRSARARPRFSGAGTGAQLAMAATLRPSPRDILLDGQSNLLSAAADLDRGCRVCARWKRGPDRELLERTLKRPGICVFIGAEANWRTCTEVSVVGRTATAREDRPLGTSG